MRRTSLGLVLALAVLLSGCAGNGVDDATTKRPQGGASPTPTTAPTPDLEAALDELTKDALAVDPRVEVVEPRATPEAFAETLYREDIFEFGRGAIFVPASLTVRFPRLTHRRHGKVLLRMFKKNGFGSKLASDLADYTSGLVQKSHDFRCRFERTRDAAWLRCIPWDLFYFMETDVVAELMSLHFDETGDPDAGCWEVTYPHAHGAEPPVAGVLRTGTCQGPEEFRAYLDEGEGWKRVARAASYADLGRELGKVVCVPELRSAFTVWCPSGTA